MSIFTVVIIIWVIYQLGVSLIKKGKQQTVGKFSEGFKLPDNGSIREVLQETSQESPQPRRFADVFAQVEGGQGTEGTQGVEGSKADLDTEKEGSNKTSGGVQAVGDVRFLTKERELVQGVIWAEILGKPRAVHPFRGPRS